MSAGTIGRLAWGDFLERTRRYAFLVTLAFSLYAGYAFLPPNHSTYVTLRLGTYRGVYNSAWVGAAIALLTAIFLGIVGFYLIKNAVERDRLTGVGPLLAATPLTRPAYILSKVLSNFAVLAIIALSVALSGALTQLVRAESTVLQPWRLLAPYLFLTLPSMLCIAAVAVFFECVPGLRGGVGNIAYFFLWSFGMVASGVGSRSGGSDFIGFGWLLPSMLRACKAAFPGYDPSRGELAIGLNFSTTGAWNMQTFVWNGISWSAPLLASRLLWIGVAAAFATAAAFCFDRFSEASLPLAARRRPRKRRSESERAAVPAPISPGFIAAGLPASFSAPAARSTGLSRLARLAAAETRLLLKGVSTWWYLVAAGLWVASALLPFETARLRILPLAWIWPVLLWSSLGTREGRFGTGAIVFSTPHPMRFQLMAAWLGGVAVALLTGSILGIRLLVQAGLADFGGFLVGALFIPALALTLGIWTGTSRSFEAIYTFLWYAGPLQPIPYIDFMGASPVSIRLGTPLFVLAVTGLLLALAAAGRNKQLRT
ncbi:MAG TPA: hypothetical protein VFW45_13770 [Candidatus Polarisedimenticolia bacterium]|nr:hypothetical protein [Candidatus Polarisedimenticolia bacterium]